MTHCNEQRTLFHPHFKREVEVDFSAEPISSDGGGLLLREVEQRLGIIDSFVDCFHDYRDPDRIEFSVRELLTQQIMGLALGYEDLNDHDFLRHDRLLALIVGRSDITGQDRRDAQDRGKPLAGKSTLNRLQLTPPGPSENSRYKKIAANIESIHDTLIDLFIRLRSLQGTPDELIIDFDATDDPVHGDQLGKFFHGYYGQYCFMPLYAFCDGWPLVAQLRPSNIDGAAGTREHLARIVPKLRAAWPEVKLIVRGDGGFCREPILRWCEENAVDYVIGLPKNDRLKKEIKNEQLAAGMFYRDNRQSARLFKCFEYQTLKSWSQKRTVVAKAEHLSKGENPRFVVTSLALARTDPQALYEQLYCARGEMENRIKEQQLMLFADRTSAHTMRANQLRLTFSTIAYVLHHALRTFGLTGTEFESAQAETIRTRVLKIGAQIQVSVRRVWVRLSASHPLQRIFETILSHLRTNLPPPQTS